MAENNYPQDEFDRLAARRAIRGTHRRKESMLKWWIALAVIVVLAPTAGWAIVQFWGSQGSSSQATTAPTASTGAGTSDSPADDSQGGDSPSQTESPSDDAGSPGTDATGTDEPSPSDSSSSASNDSAGVQGDRRILVLNGAGVTGFAAEKQETLNGRGFSNVSVDNYSGGAPTASSVFYPKDDDRQTALSIANSLGISESQVELAPSATGGDQIVVVLRSDLRNS